MTTEQLRGMADEAFVEILAQRVVEKLLARQKQALVVYTGSNIGEAAALEAMGRLRGEGFTFRVLLSRGASGLLDVERLRSVLEPEKLWVETPEETPEALTARYDTILVPAMTVHTAAHVAACMADTPASAVILDGLMRGKNVVVNIDGCCPDHAERLERAGTSEVAVDSVGAGTGEIVIVCKGSSARYVFGKGDAPVDTSIVGIVDTVEVG